MPPVPDDSYDLVLFNEVFEHLRLDLVFTMTEVRRVLKNDGTLLLSTPNHRSLVGIWTLLWHCRGCHVYGSEGSVSDPQSVCEECHLANDQNGGR